MEEFGVTPEHWTRFRALMGDPIDGIKPLAGVGPKTAVKMLNIGIDPAKFYFRYNSRKACTKYRHLEHSWQKIRAAFAVSEIVQHENFFSGQSRKDLVAALNLVDDPRRNPEKSHDVLYSAFIDLCAEYELESLLSSRYDLFKIP
jgi:5'-3' exonuclease